MSKIDEKKNHLDFMQQAGQKQRDGQQAKEVQMLFDILKSAGINPADPQAVNMFLENLYTQNPDLYSIVVPIMESIIGGGEPQQESPEASQSPFPEIPNGA
jgi:hypothetical protein